MRTAGVERDLLLSPCAGGPHVGWGHFYYICPWKLSLRSEVLGRANGSKGSFQLPYSAQMNLIIQGEKKSITQLRGHWDPNSCIMKTCLRKYSWMVIKTIAGLWNQVDPNTTVYFLKIFRIKQKSFAKPHEIQCVQTLVVHHMTDFKLSRALY